MATPAASSTHQSDCPNISDGPETVPKFGDASNSFTGPVLNQNVLEDVLSFPDGTVDSHSTLNIATEASTSPEVSSEEVVETNVTHETAAVSEVSSPKLTKEHPSLKTEKHVWIQYKDFFWIRYGNTPLRANAGPEYEKAFNEELAKLQRLYGGGDLTKFPEFNFSESSFDEEDDSTN